MVVGTVSCSTIQMVPWSAAERVPWSLEVSRSTIQMVPWSAAERVPWSLQQSAMVHDTDGTMVHISLYHRPWTKTHRYRWYRGSQYRGYHDPRSRLYHGPQDPMFGGVEAWHSPGKGVTQTKCPRKVSAVVVCWLAWGV